MKTDIKTDQAGENDLRSAHSLRAIIDTVLDPIFVKDRQHRWIEGNKAFWDLIGGEAKAKGKTDYDFFPKELADQFWAGDERVFAGETFNEEEKLVDSDGKKLDIATKKIAFTMPDGELGIVGVIRDVTQQRKNEIELRAHRDHLADLVQERTGELERQRRLYEAILASTLDLVYVFDLQYRFTYANTALLQMWGKTWDEAVGKTCLELGYEPWHAEMHNREIDEVVRTKKPIRGEVPFTGTQGRRIYDYILVPVIGKNGEVEVVAGTTRDVTERKAIEEVTRKNEERQRLALEASHSFGIWDWDIANNLFTADERFGSLFGLSPEEAKTGVTQEYAARVVHPDDIARVKAAVDDVLKTGGKYHEEYRVVQKNGEVRWISARGHVQFDDNGKPVRFPGAGVDVTREREAMDALRAANQKKDEFLATLAHELRNPLAPVRNSLFLFKSDDFSPEKKQQAYEVVERQVEQMVRLVDDLMDVSRINTGKIELRKQSVLLEDVINQASEIANPLIRECGHSLEINIPRTPVYLDGDTVRLSQIFANLLNNSAKYMHPGGSIAVEAVVEGGEAVIKVIDTGIGIADEILPYVFDMFSQADSSIEKSRGGLGIGLTITKKLVELHDGVIKAESRGAGQGSCFTVMLPLAKTAAAALEAGPDEKGDLSALRILIVDDNLASAQTLGWAVELFNCEAIICHDGPEAIRLAKELKPHVILLDIGLPGMNGYTVCQEMRKLPGLENSILIAQTGWGQQEHRLKSQEAGFHHHLVKPIDIKVLGAMLNDIGKEMAQTRI